MTDKDFAEPGAAKSFEPRPNSAKVRRYSYILPATLPFADAVLASARANVLVAALVSGDWSAAGRMLGGDLFHERFRQPLLPDYARLREVALAAGVHGAALSGAGPAVIAFAPPGRGPAVAEAFRAAFPRFETRVVAEERRGASVASGGAS